MEQKSTLYVWYMNGDVWGFRLDENKDEVIMPPCTYRTASDLYSALIDPNNRRVIYDQPPKEFLLRDYSKRSRRNF